MLFRTVEAIVASWVGDVKTIFVACIVVVHAHFVRHIVEARHIHLTAPRAAKTHVEEILVLIPPWI